MYTMYKIIILQPLNITVKGTVLSVHGRCFYMYALKGDEVAVFTLTVFTSYVMPSLQVIDPSCPTLKNYEQLLKKQAD